MNAFFQAYHHGLFHKKHWLPNIISGLIVGVVALPLAMAFAIASGASPEQGIYTAIIASLFVSVFGGSRVQIAGPTGAFIVILSAITAQYGIEGLQIATLMAGVMLFFLGLLRMGTVIKYIPEPVIVGFTSGIAIIIWVGQWKDFFGLSPSSGEHFHEKFWSLLQAFPQLHLTTTLLSLLALILVLYFPKLPGMKRVPGPLAALVIVTLIQAIFQFQGVQTLGSVFGGIAQGLPSFHLPSITSHRIMELIGPAITIALLGSIESLLSAVVADGMTQTRHDSNQELIGQGLANIVAPLFGGFAATGAIARTATNIRNGGNSPLSGVVHAVTLILILLFLSPLAYYIPLPVLAAILFVVAWNMSDAKHFVRICQRAPIADVAILIITFSLTILTDLVIAVNTGIILSILHFLRRMAQSVEIYQADHQDLELELVHQELTGLPNDLAVYCIEGPVFFAAIENFSKALEHTHGDPKTLILYLKWVPFIDLTGIETLEEIIQQLQERQIRVILSGANPRVFAKLKKAGVLDRIGQDNYFNEFTHAIKACLKDHDFNDVSAPKLKNLINQGSSDMITTS